MCVCCVWGDKCNDFVFHYLLDYSCRVLFSRFCTIPRSQKTVDFIQCVGCVENSFALVPYFCSRKIASRGLHTDAVVQFDVRFSKLFGVYYFCLCSFLPHFFLFSGSGRLRKCENSPFGQSAFPCFCELAFFLLFSRLHCRRSERRPQQIVIEVGVRVRMLGCTTKGGGQSATRLLWSGKNLNQSVEWPENREENPHTQVRINKKNCRFFFGVAMARNSRKLPGAFSPRSNGHTCFASSSNYW